MGMFDTMNQGNKVLSAVGTPMGGNSIQKAVPNAMGQGFAQQKPVSNMQKPNNNMAGMGQSVGNAASKFMQNRPGAGGSNSMLQQKQLMQKNQQAAATGGAIGGSYGQMVSSNPQLEQYRNTGREHGQDMSWMDQPGALAMGPSSPSSPSNQAQSGLAPLQTPYEQQIQASKPNAVMGASQSSLSNSMNPMQAAQEQMRGYEGPDLGSQDPRELARMGQMGPLQGSVGQPSLNAPPFGGEQPGSNSFQSMLQNTSGQRPDVMPRGLGPSVVMDENGLEPRRGAR